MVYLILIIHRLIYTNNKVSHKDIYNLVQINHSSIPYTRLCNTTVTLTHIQMLNISLPIFPITTILIPIIKRGFICIKMIISCMSQHIFPPEKEWEIGNQTCSQLNTFFHLRADFIAASLTNWDPSLPSFNRDNSLGVIYKFTRPFKVECI